MPSPKSHVHRTRPESKKREQHIAALELLAEGYTYRQIGDRMGYAKSTVHGWITEALREREYPLVDAYREAQLSRLERLHETHWPAAMSGDIPAGKMILSIIDREARLMGTNLESKTMTAISIAAAALDAIPSPEDARRTAQAVLAQAIDSITGEVVP